MTWEGSQHRSNYGGCDNLFVFNSNAAHVGVSLFKSSMNLKYLCSLFIAETIKSAEL